MTSPSRTAVMVAAEDWFLAQHWLPAIRAAREDGWRMIVATPVARHGEVLAATGAVVVPLPLRRQGRGPTGEAAAVATLARLYRRVRPSVVHHIALKPILYGTAAAQWTGVARIVNTLPGLGHLFTTEGSGTPLHWLLRRWLRRSLRAATVVQVQNPDDAERLIIDGMVQPECIDRIGAVGVDLDVYRFTPESDGGVPLVLLPARMLREKGVGEFVAAARLLREQGVVARFVLVGGEDLSNPAAVSREDLDEWTSSGAVDWYGERDDIPSLLAEAAVVVLPSYREGIPKSLQEAAASGRAIVATDVPGCREVVRHEWNGLLVPPRDAPALAKAIAALLNDPQRRRAMGARGRELAEMAFDDRIQGRRIVAAYGSVATDA